MNIIYISKNQISVNVGFGICCPMRKLIVFFGVAGSGKGTQTHLIKKSSSTFEIVSAGDTLRESIHKIPELQKLLSQGKIVPEEITERLLKQKLEKLSNKNILLDGYPRTEIQYEIFKKWRNSFDECLGIHLKLKNEKIFERLKGRWIHMESGRTYHEKFCQPKINFFDDLTNEKLIQREDDLSESAIKNRIETFENITKPVILKFKKEFKLFEIEGEKDIQKIETEIKNILLI
eukprot:gene668-8169_t